MIKFLQYLHYRPIGRRFLQIGCLPVKMFIFLIVALGETAAGFDVTGPDVPAGGLFWNLVRIKPTLVYLPDFWSVLLKECRLMGP